LGARIAALDGVRALAFLLVFFHHALQLPLGWVGVDLFFVMSGFLITRNLLDLKSSTSTAQSAKFFFFRRALRILPPYYLALLLIGLYEGFPNASLGWYATFSSNIRDVFEEPHRRALSVLWSIAIEEQFYLLWPWVVLLLPVSRAKWVLWGMIGVAFLCRWAFTDLSFHAVYRLTLCRMDLLALGAGLAWIESQQPQWMQQHQRHFFVLLAASMAVFTAFAFLLPDFRTHKNTLLFNLLGFSCIALASVSLLALTCTSASSWLQRILLNPVLQYLGSISYMAYLVHVLSLDIMHDQGLRGLERAIAALALTTGFASLSYKLLEKPLQRFKNQLKPAIASS
jgi:peptidoglycan/LPS O-acetylase OafA/YrhL